MHNESVHHEEIDALTRLLVEQEGCSERVFRTVLHVPRRTHPGSRSVPFLCCTVKSGVCARVSHTPIVVACHPNIVRPSPFEARVSCNSVLGALPVLRSAADT